MSKIKLFLSYGRADAKEVALRIKDDLEKQDYKIWMDENELKAGTDYMTEIAKNLKDSSAVIALMSPHSVRSVNDGALNDSVCLDELAYAKDYPGRIVPVMVSKCKVPIFIYRLDYVDLCSWRQNDDEYEKGLQSIIHGIEAALRNEINYRTSQEKLIPYDFSPFLKERIKDFVGRDWLFTEVINWLEGNHPQRALLIKADPGFGKSAFIGRWVTLNPGGHLLAYHFCQIDTKTTLEPDCFVRNLAAMISSQIPEYEEMLKESEVEAALNLKNCQEDPDTGLKQGIIAPLMRLNPPGDGIYCIIVDALDEAILLKNGKTTIVNLLVNHLSEFPDWVRLIATTRDETSVLYEFKELNPKYIKAEDTRNSIKNTEDAKLFLTKKFTEEPLKTILCTSKISLEEVVETLLQRSDGNFLYIHYALEGLLVGTFHLDRPDEFPNGLTGFYKKAFIKRFEKEQDYQPVAGILSILLAARQPIDIDIIVKASGFSSEFQVTKLLASLSGYIKVSDKTYTFYHRSFAEWLRDKENLKYHIEPLQGDAKLADAGWEDYKRNGKELNDYMQKYLPDHLTAIGRYEQLTEFLTDFTILEIIWQNGREFELMRHWRLIIDRVAIVEAYQKSLEKLIEKEPDLNRIAKISGKVGALLRDLGLHDKALPFAKKAFELLKDIADQDKEELASSLLILAELYRHLTEFDAAEPLYLESLRLQEDIWPDSVEVGKIVYALCVFYNTCSKRDIDKSIYYDEWAIRIQEKQTPLNYGSLADAINDKGILLSAKGNKEEALPYYEKARKLFETGFPEGHPELAVVLTNIAEYYFDKKEFQKALDLNMKALSMRSMFVVPYDIKCQRFRRDGIKYYMNMSKNNEAQKLAEEVIKIGENGYRYSFEDKISDISMLIFITLLTQDLTTREKNFKKLFSEIQKDPLIFDRTNGDAVVQLFNYTILAELNQGKNDSALEYNKIFVNFLTKFEPQPYKSLSLYFSLLADLFHEIGAEDIEKQMRETAESWKIAGDKRLPYLLKIIQAEEFLNKSEFLKLKELMSDVFTDALIREVDIEEWKPYLSRLANKLALKLKNDHHEYELSKWFYQQGYLLDPGNGNLIGNYAFLLTSVLEDHTEAAIYYEKALQVNRNDANCLSNYAVYHTNIKKEYEKADELFAQAYKLNSPFNNSILSNYAALKIIKGELEMAYNLAKESYQGCMENPDRIMARPLFCAAVISAIKKMDYDHYLAQIKTLFLMGFQRVPWQANALIEYMKNTLPAKDFLLLEALWLAICNKENDLELFERWNNLRPMPFDRPWPEK